MKKKRFQNLGCWIIIGGAFWILLTAILMYVLGNNPIIFLFALTGWLALAFATTLYLMKFFDNSSKRK